MLVNRSRSQQEPRDWATNEKQWGVVLTDGLIARKGNHIPFGKDAARREGWDASSLRNGDENDGEQTGDRDI